MSRVLEKGELCASVCVHVCVVCVCASVCVHGCVCVCVLVLCVRAVCLCVPWVIRELPSGRL